jgi:hypothetical protein
MAETQLEVERTFIITKGDKRIVLTQQEMAQFLLQPEVFELIVEMGLSSNEGTLLSERLLGTPNVADLQNSYDRQVLFPNGFAEKIRISSDKKAAHKAVFIYAYNPVGQEYGFKIVNDAGRLSQFYKVGSIHDAKSIIGSFLRSIPNTEKPMIKRDFLKLGLQSVTEGRRLKALIDIAELEGYLEKTTLPSRKGRTGYLKTAKLDELGGG